MNTTKAVTLSEVQQARDRLFGKVVRTPLVRLNVDDAPAEIYLKTENLQPFGSFKVRGAGNFIYATGPESLRAGVWTASAGNMAQSLAYFARRLDLKCTVVVPETAPEAKVSALNRLGVGIIRVSMLQWLDIYRTHHYPGLDGTFVHAFADPAVMAGNGTIALEILEELPDVEAIVVPYGGGGLSCGIAAAVRALKPGVKVYACEVATAAPLAASMAAGEPTEIHFTPSFVDGIGAPFVFPEMFALAQSLLDGSLVVEVEQVAQALRALASGNRIIAEGAGATPVAAALDGQAGTGKIACVVSGGNIDLKKLVSILEEITPMPPENDNK